MSRHGHRHSRITRIINAKHQREADNEDFNDDPESKSYDLGTMQNPKVSPDLSPIEPCDPLQNTTCSETLDGVTEELLVKRQAESTEAAVQTVVQVVVTDTQTVWQATGTQSPITGSDSTGQVTSTGSSATTNSLPATSPADCSTTQPVSSASSSTQSATTSKPLVPISSPRVSPASSSRHHTSTPLNSAASPTTTATSSYATTSVYYSSSSSTSYYWSDSAYSSSFSSSSATDFDGGALQTGTSTGSGTGSGSGSSANNGSSGSSISPTTSKIVGGVVGSVAGLAVIFLLLFYVLRKRGYLDRFFKGKGTQTLPSSDMGASGSREMFEGERSLGIFAASSLAPAFVKRWRHSSATAMTDSTIDSGSSERGFQKISGRKIPPVLTHGGDGFGGGLDGDSPTIPDCLIGLSPAPAGQGPLSPPTSHRPPPTSLFGSPLDASYTRETDEMSLARPSKVQLPVSSSVNFGSPTAVNPTFPIAQPQSAVPVQRADAIGRSHPSHDGSRGSRFTESLDM